MKDKWVPSCGCLLHHALTQQLEDQISKKVNNMVSSLDGWKWNWASLSMLLPANIRVHIVSIPPPLGFPDLDILAWSPSVDGNFSVQSAHAAIAHSNIMISDPLFKLIRKWCGLERIRLFLWLVATAYK